MSAALRSPRVVSLLSSATEILHCLGGIELLVGRSHECDYPSDVLRLPCCTKPLIDIHADSRSIDEQVKNAARNALSIYSAFDDVLEELQPTHILTQVQCEVCAVSLKDVERSIASRLQSAPQIIPLNPNSLQDIWADVHRVGDALGLDAAGAVARLQREMASFCRNASGIRVAMVEWIEPLMAAGNWTPELVEMAGAVNLFGKAGQHSPWMTWQELVDARPDVTIVAPCGFDLQRTEAEMHWLTERPEFSNLGSVFLADGNAWFNRPGPRVVEALEILGEILHGTGTRFEGSGWKPFA